MDKDCNGTIDKTEMTNFLRKIYGLKSVFDWNGSTHWKFSSESLAYFARKIN